MPATMSMEMFGLLLASRKLEIIPFQIRNAGNQFTVVYQQTKKLTLYLWIFSFTFSFVKLAQQCIRTYTLLTD